MRFPDKEFLEKEIQKSTGISKAGVNFAIRELYKIELIEKATKGKVSFYGLKRSLPFIRQLKVADTVNTLSPLIKRLGKISSKIILYGSCSRGEDVSDSDIDLFVVTNDPEEAGREIRRSSLSKKIKAITRAPLKFIAMEKKEPVFYREIERGVILWEAKDGS
jgi:predicted nucleotidyltransferase